MADIGHPTPWQYPASWLNGYELLAVVLQRMMRGEMNNAGEFTLDANQASTTITDLRVGANSRIVYSPTTANASAEIGNGTIYVSAKASGSFTITHANNAQADRTFDYMVSG